MGKGRFLASSMTMRRACQPVAPGRVLGANAGVDEIRGNIREMLAVSDYRDRARRTAATIARQDGRAAAVDELEALLPVS